MVFIFTNTKFNNQIVTGILRAHVSTVSVGVGMVAGLRAAVSRRHVDEDAGYCCRGLCFHVERVTGRASHATAMGSRQLFVPLF